MPARAKRKKKRGLSPRRRGRRLGIALALLFIGFGIYLGYLNFLINTRFEGDTWALPSRVYARALELYPGLELNRDQLEYELELSSYLRVQGEPLPGQYRRLGESLELHARRFEFASGIQPARLLQLHRERLQRQRDGEDAGARRQAERAALLLARNLEHHVRGAAQA